MFLLNLELCLKVYDGVFFILGKQSYVIINVSIYFSFFNIKLFLKDQ